MVWFYELHYREKKFTEICCAVHRNELYTGILNFGFLLSGTCRQKLSVEWHWLKCVLSQIFLHFGQFYLYSRQACNKRLANWTAIIDTLTWNGFTRNTKHGFTVTRGNGQIWLGTSLVVLQFILVFFHIVVCNCLFTKNIRFHSDIGEMKEYFRRYVSLKIFNFLLGT